MVKFVDNNYRTFQKERRAKGIMISNMQVLPVTDTIMWFICSPTALAPDDQSIHEFNKYVVCQLYVYKAYYYMYTLFVPCESITLTFDYCSCWSVIAMYTVFARSDAAGTIYFIA